MFSWVKLDTRSVGASPQAFYYFASEAPLNENTEGTKPFCEIHEQASICACPTSNMKSLDAKSELVSSRINHINITTTFTFSFILI